MMFKRLAKNRTVVLLFVAMAMGGAALLIQAGDDGDHGGMSVEPSAKIVSYGDPVSFTFSCSCSDHEDGDVGVSNIPTGMKVTQCSKSSITISAYKEDRDGDGTTEYFVPAGSYTITGSCSRHGGSISATLIVVGVSSISYDGDPVLKGESVSKSDFDIVTVPEGHEDMVTVAPLSLSSVGRPTITATCGDSTATTNDVLVYDVIFEEWPIGDGGVHHSMEARDSSGTIINYPHITYPTLGDIGSWAYTMSNSNNSFTILHKMWTYGQEWTTHCTGGYLQASGESMYSIYIDIGSATATVTVKSTVSGSASLAAVPSTYLIYLLNGGYYRTALDTEVYKYGVAYAPSKTDYIEEIGTKPVIKSFENVTGKFEVGQCEASTSYYDYAAPYALEQSYNSGTITLE